MTELHLKDHQVVSRPKWLEDRRRLLAKEKELTRLGDELSTERRKLPWVRVEKEYVFEGPEGNQTLADLFDGRSQLIVYHFMFGPDWEEGCPSCSMAADHFDSSVVHLQRRDVTLIAISRAPFPNIEAFKKRMGWHFKWVSSYGDAFNHDFRVSFTKDEMFYKAETGDIFHTYSSHARGGEPLLGVYFHLDLVPKGRDESGLPWPMAWVRHHDKYSQS